MDKIEKRKTEHNNTINYIDDNTLTLKEFWDKYKHRKFKKKYAIGIKIISVFLIASELFGIVLVGKKLQTIKMDTITETKNIDIDKVYGSNIYANIETSTPTPTPIPTSTPTPTPTPVVIDDTGRDNLSLPVEASPEDIINRYSKVFELDSDIVKDIINERTNNLTDDEALSEFYPDYIENGNMTAAIINYIRNISSHPEDYGYSDDEIRSGVDFETDLTPEEQLVIICDIYEVNPYSALGIMIAEWGHPGNRNNSTYNVFSWDGAWNKQNRTVAMIIAVYGLKEKYHLDVDTGSNEINSMASIYCPPNASNWASMVNYNASLAKDNGIFFDYSDSEIEEFALPNYTYDEYVDNGYNIPNNYEIEAMNQGGSYGI